MSVVVDILLRVLLLFMLINTSSMFEFHMHVAVVVMFYILELIMEIMPNNPTLSLSSRHRLHCMAPLTLYGKPRLLVSDSDTTRPIHT
jgi:hypothetical protein